MEGSVSRQTDTLAERVLRAKKSPKSRPQLTLGEKG
jgi:hypothetical protein